MLQLGYSAKEETSEGILGLSGIFVILIFFQRTEAEVEILFQRRTCKPTFRKDIVFLV